MSKKNKEITEGDEIIFQYKSYTIDKVVKGEIKEYYSKHFKFTDKHLQNDTSKTSEHSPENDGLKAEQNTEPDKPNCEV